MNDPVEQPIPAADAPDAPDDAGEPCVKAVLPTGNAVAARLSHCRLEDQVRLALAMLARNRGIFQVPLDFEIDPPVQVAAEHVGEYQDSL